MVTDRSGYRAELMELCQKIVQSGTAHAYEGLLQSKQQLVSLLERPCKLFICILSLPIF